jgi:hypothetical protein
VFLEEVVPAGIALIFDKTTNWLSTTPINVFPAANSQFGNSVCIKGNTIVIGAPNETVNGLTGRGKSILLLLQFWMAIQRRYIIAFLRGGDFNLASAVYFSATI